MPSYFILGSTGLCGSHFLTAALQSPEISKILTISRRQPTPKQKDIDVSKLQATIEKDSSKWPELIKQNSKESIGSSTSIKGNTFFSGFGTTRKAAGSAENFIAIDRDININAFQAAKDSGVYETAVLISAMNSSIDSSFLYPKTKAEIEEAVTKMGFKRTIILKPGILLGEREQSKGFPNNLSETVGGFLRNTLHIEKGGFPIYGEEVAKVSLFLSSKPAEKDGEVLFVGPSEMLKIARENGFSKQ
ncbi:unnamed protein product [Ambrosiozyma monospora]|uniref:Unnamed protein product n=1 Tax=Ambrosiozyma monospora TaxID=43982 RepID=A0A9W6YZW6_AMBMO|nr:unnamed protein product [Ambrosiozyma monospora]